MERPAFVREAVRYDRKAIRKIAGDIVAIEGRRLCR